MDESLTKITVNIYTRDVDALKAFYRRTGYQRALRLVIRKHCRELQHKQDTILQDEENDLERAVEAAGES